MKYDVIEILTKREINKKEDKDLRKLLEFADKKIQQLYCYKDEIEDTLVNRGNAYDVGL